jgi:hypothetical protein
LEIQTGEELQQLNSNQHGSRRGRQSLDPVHLQLISMDLCPVLKLNMASFDNDASDCYDHIIVALGMLAKTWNARQRSKMPRSSSANDDLKFDGQLSTP